MIVVMRLLCATIIAAAYAVHTSSASASPPATVVGPLPVSNADNLNYGVDVFIGSRGQRFRVMVDSGSQFLWVPAFNATVEGGGTPPASFNPADSTTFVSQHRI